LRGSRWRPRTPTSIVAARAAVERAATAVAVSAASPVPVPCDVSPEGSLAEVLAKVTHADAGNGSAAQQQQSHVDQDCPIVEASEESPAPSDAPSAAPLAAQLALQLDLQPHAPFVEPRVTNEDLAEGLKAVITQMVEVSSIEYRMTCFHAVRPPAMSIQDYFARIQRFFGCSGACYVLGLLYLDRLMKRHPDYNMSSLSCHRLVITSIMVAAKFHDDVFYSNAYYAEVGGVKISEINGLELRFVQLLNWELNAQSEEYEVYEKILLKAAAASA
jgi:hypothetical protein